MKTLMVVLALGLAVAARAEDGCCADAAFKTALADEGEAEIIRLSKALGDTVAEEVDAPMWEWPKR